MISAEDFNLLQEQLIELKRYKYETSEREKKFLNEIKSLKDQIDHHDNSPITIVEPTTPKKGSLFSNVLTTITKDKGKLSDLQDENEILKKTIQQNTLVHQEQSEALQHNVKSLFETNSILEEEIKSFKKEIETYTTKIEEQQITIRKLQFDIAESYSNVSNNNNSNNGSSCSTPEISSNINMNQINQNLISNSYLIESILNYLSNENIITKPKEEINNIEEIKNQLLQIVNEEILSTTSNNGNSIPTSPQSQSATPKEIIFHPLGEPEYNPEDEKEKNKLRDTIKNLMEQIKETDQKYRQLQQQLKDQQLIQEESQQLVIQWQEKHKQAEINRVKIEEKLSNDIKSLGDEIKEKIEQDNNNQLIIKKHSDTISQLQVSMKLDNENFDKAIQDKIDEVRNSKLSFERQISDLTDKSNIFKMSRDEYLEQFNKSAQELLEKDKLIESQVIEIQRLEKENKDLSSNLSNCTSELNDNKLLLSEYQSKSKKLEEKLVMERSSFDSLNDKFNKLNSDHSEMDISNQSVEKELLEIKQQLEEKLIELNSLSESHSKLEIEFTNQTNQLNSLLDQHNTVSEENENSKCKLLQLEEKAKELIVKLEEIENLKSILKEKNEKIILLEPEFESLKSSYESCCQEIVKLKVQLEDSESEKKISEKKSQKMIKDLKLELSKERENILTSSSSQINNNNSSGISNISLGGSISVPGSPMLTKSASSVSLPTTPQVIPMKLNGSVSGISSGKSPHHHQRSHSVNPSTFQNHSLPPVNIDQLKNDFEMMGRKLGEMGNEKYKLEEKVRTLESNVSTLNQELDKKTQVVRFYISKTQLGKATTEDEKSKRLKGGVLGSFWRNSGDQNKVAEMVEKMDIVLQENILKNIQLSTDIEVLGDESVKLKSENSKLKSILKENNIDLEK